MIENLVSRIIESFSRIKPESRKLPKESDCGFPRRQDLVLSKKGNVFLVSTAVTGTYGIDRGMYDSTVVWHLGKGKQVFDESEVSTQGKQLDDFYKEHRGPTFLEMAEERIPSLNYHNKLVQKLLNGQYKLN